MKQFNPEFVLENPKRVMRYIGMWPEANASVSYNIRGLLVLLVQTIATILLLIKGLENFIEGNYENGSYVLCIMMATSHASFVVWLLLKEKPLFLEILANLEDSALLYHNENFDIILQDNMQFSKKLFNALVIVCVNAALTILLSEYVFGYNTNPRLFPIKADHSQLIPYASVWLFFTGAIFYCGLIIGSFEGLVLTFLFLGIAQLKLLQKEIIHAVELYPSDITFTEEEIRYYDKIVHAELSKCVKRHNAIERFLASVEAKFSEGFLIQYCLTLAVTGFIGLNFIFATITSPDFLRCVFFFIADISQVFVVYYYCNEIIFQSDLIRDACYMSNWELCGPSVRKSLYIMMERTKRPFYFTIGKFSIISLETFMMILKTSMSYFTVLKNIYADDHTE